MSKIVVMGGSICGLSTAMLLAKDGHEVTVLERDPAPPPVDAVDAWAGWERKGVNQFRLLHFFAARFRHILEQELPEVVDALDAGGALRFNAVAQIPDEMKGGAQDGDDRFETITARRPIAEAAFGTAAEAMPGVTVRRGVSVDALLTGDEVITGVPDVVGVRTDGGEEIRADLVVDASGRRSPLPRLLAAIGARPPEEDVEDSGFVYYGRHFRSADGSVPALMSGLLTAAGSVSVLTLPADNGTWGIGVIARGDDAELRGLKDNDRWMAAIQSFPLLAHWTDGEPIDDVAVMAKIEDRHRRFVVDGAPVSTGVLVVGDAWACTNPSLGRGATMALMHVVALRDVLRELPIDDPSLGVAFDAATQATVEPWYEETVGFDRHRLAECKAAADGKPYEPGDPAWEITQAMQFGAGSDPELLRGFIEVVSMLSTPNELLARPGFLDKVIEHGAGWREAVPLAPSRDELVKLAAG